MFCKINSQKEIKKKDAEQHPKQPTLEKENETTEKQPEKTPEKQPEKTNQKERKPKKPEPVKVKHSPQFETHLKQFYDTCDLRFFFFFLFINISKSILMNFPK